MNLSEASTLTDDSRTSVAAQRLRDAREAAGLSLTDLAKRSGVSYSQLHRYESGKIAPSVANAMRIASVLGGQFLQYQGFGEDPIYEKLATHRAPLVGEVQAGAWRSAIEEDFAAGASVDYPASLGDLRDLRAYIVRGESMNRVYQDGRVVVVASLISNGLTLAEGNIALVQRRNRDGDWEVSLKRYSAPGILVPESTHPDFQEPLDLVRDNAHEDSDVIVAGVVVYDGERVLAVQRKADITRDDEVMMRHARGESHPKIAAKLGISRERVRQIVMAHGGAPRSPQRARKMRVVKGGKSE